MNAADAQIIRCPKCGANNRVSPEKLSEQKAVCGRCKTLLSAETRPIHVTDANFAAEVERSPLPILLDLWAAWCGPCRIIAPVIDELARELSGRVRVGKVDVDKNPATSSRFRVQSIPLLVILKDGREVDRMLGVQSKQAILQRLQKYM